MSQKRRYLCYTLVVLALTARCPLEGATLAPQPRSAKDAPETETEDKDSKDKAAPKKKFTRIRDALTIDANLYGIDLSKAKLGEAGDIITRDALKESTRIAIDEDAKVEEEVIVEDQHETRYERATAQAKAGAAAEQVVREKERTAHARKMDEKRSTLLLVGGAVIVVAFLAIVIALRKMRAFDA